MTDSEKLAKLQEAIAWRKKAYEEEIKTGIDKCGDPMTPENIVITMNMYNLLCALEASCEDE